jgi:hypothetical protein
MDIEDESTQSIEKEVTKPIKKKREYVMTEARMLAVERMKEGRRIKVQEINLQKDSNKRILEESKKTKKTKKQVIVMDDNSSSEEEENQIIIRRKRSKKPLVANVNQPPPPPPSPPDSPEYVAEAKPSYSRLRRL